MPKATTPQQSPQDAEQDEADPRLDEAAVEPSEEEPEGPLQRHGFRFLPLGRDRVGGKGHQQRDEDQGPNQHGLEQLFAEVWTRDVLSLRDRRMLLLGAIAALGERDTFNLIRFSALTEYSPQWITNTIALIVE